MTLTVGDIAAWMDKTFPPELQEEWDKVGLICGARNDPVHRILLAVDPTEAVIDEALQWDAQLVITHHPLFLRGTSFVSTDTSKGRIIHRLIRANSALFNAHTNADAAKNGVAQALAVAAGLNPETLRPLAPNPAHPELGIGRIGQLDTPVTLGELANYLSQALPNSPAGLLVAGNLEQKIEKIAVSGGSGQSLLELARESGAEVFITADLRHHPAQDFLEESSSDGKPSPALIMPSHWASEWVWLPRLQAQIELWAAQENQPVETKISTIVSEPWDAYIPTSSFQDETSDSLV